MWRTGFKASISIITVIFCLSGWGTSFSSIQPGADDRCPVCGMFVINYPDWMAQVQFDDGLTRFFDGPKDLFRYLFSPDQYDRDHSGTPIRAILVTDYYGLEPIEAREALFVLGADVYGPMGRELIPFRTEDAAREFKVDHRGDLIVTFGEITEDVIHSLE